MKLAKRRLLQTLGIGISSVCSSNKCIIHDNDSTATCEPSVNELREYERSKTTLHLHWTATADANANVGFAVTRFSHVALIYRVTFKNAYLPLHNIQTACSTSEERKTRT